MALAESRNALTLRSIATAMIAVFVFGVACWVAWPRATEPAAATGYTPKVASLPAPAMAASASPSLHFEPNRGQADPNVQFLARGKGFALYLLSDEVAFVTRTSSQASMGQPSAEDAGNPDVDVTEAAHISRSVIKMSFPGARLSPTIEGLDPQQGRSNYLLGNDPRGWQTDVPHFGQVRYSDLFPGVDLVFHSNGGLLEYDFVVAAGASPEPIRIRFEGAESLSVNDAGGLSVSVPGGELIQRAPVVYQRLDGRRQAVAGRYVIEQPGEVRFVMGDYDPGRELVIDPAVIFSDYFGGSANEFPRGMSIDANGDPIVIGWTESADLPLLNPIDGTLANRDIFITKRNGKDLSTIFSTFIGGSSADEPAAIAVDAKGSIWVTGTTFSSDFPTKDPIDGMFGGFQDAFAFSINAAGSSLEFSTYIGGTNTETGTGIAVNRTGSVFVTGVTDSTDFLTESSAQGALVGTQDFFWHNFTTGPSTLEFSSYFGGTGTEWTNLGVIEYSDDPASDQWLVAGTTSSTDMLTVMAVQPTNAGGYDFTMTIVDSAGAVQVATYYGGSGDEDFFQALERERAWETLRGWAAGNDRTCIGGSTSSSDLPPSGGAISGPDDAFVACFDPATLNPQSLIIIGGSDTDRVSEVVIGIGDKNNFSSPPPSGPRVIVFGETGSSADFPTRNPFQSGYGGGLRDAFVAEIEGLFPGSGPPGINFASFYGGSGTEIGFYGGVFTEGAFRRVHIAGATTSLDLPTFKATQGTHADGTWDVAFFTLFSGIHIFPGDDAPEPDSRPADAPRQRPE